MPLSVSADVADYALRLAILSVDLSNLNQRRSLNFDGRGSLTDKQDTAHLGCSKSLTSRVSILSHLGLDAGLLSTNIIARNTSSFTVTIMMMTRNGLIFTSLVLLAEIVGPVNAKLRGVVRGGTGSDFDHLKQRATNPTLRDEIRGKTVRELVSRDDVERPSVQKGVVQDHGERSLQTADKSRDDAERPSVQKGVVRDDGERSLQTADESPASAKSHTVKFFTIYDEFGPSVSKIGETAGLNGMMYPIDKMAGGELTEDDVIGALKGSCSVVSSTRDHLCTYELLISEEGGSNFGSVIASGSVEYKTGTGGYLIVETAGDAYEEFTGGLLSLTYQTIGDETILTGELSLA